MRVSFMTLLSSSGLKKFCPRPLNTGGYTAGLFVRPDISRPLPSSASNS